MHEDQLGQFGRAAKTAEKTVAEWLRDLGAAAIAPPVIPDNRTNEIPLSDCMNPECPVGCDDSHVLPICEEDAVALDSVDRLTGYAARSWSEEFARCRKLGDFAGDAFAEATAHIKKWPKGFKEWNERKQVAWPDEHYPLSK